MEKIPKKNPSFFKPTRLFRRLEKGMNLHAVRVFGLISYCEHLSHIVFDIILSYRKCSDVPGWVSAQTLLQTNHPNRKAPFHLYA